MTELIKQEDGEEEYIQLEEVTEPGRSVNSSVTINAAPLICVELPCKVDHPERVVPALGGVDEILDTSKNVGMTSHTRRRMNFRFRPDDVHSKPMMGDCVYGDYLKGRIIKQRNKRTGQFRYRLEISGISSVVYRFNFPADCQQLPLMQNKQNNEVESLSHFFSSEANDLLDIIKNDTREERDAPDQLSDFFCQAEVPLFLPPQLFFQSDRPSCLLFTDSYTGKDASRSSNGGNTIGISRKPRQAFTREVRFKEDPFEIPGECHPALNHGYDRILQQEETKRLEELFGERPIWSRYALMRKSGISAANLKKILPYIAFYWGTGPWARMWNRWGFDPREEKIVARKLQTVDVRVTSDEMIAAKRKTTSKLAYNMVQKVSLIEQVNEPEKPKNEVEGDEMIDINAQINNARCDNYEYHSGLLPPRRQMFYQLIDVKLAAIADLLADHEPCHYICTKSDGWLRPNQLVNIRALIGEDIKRTKDAIKLRIADQLASF